MKKTFRIRVANLFYAAALWLWELDEEDFIAGMYEGLLNEYYK